jgi:SAM-dependent methyltransferase
MFNTDITRIIQDDKTWYRHVWTLAVQDQSWVEDTARQVEFLCAVLGITGKERILDLACGYGRHALELGKRGCEVIGVDITEAYIREAERQAKAAGVRNEYVLKDVRELEYADEFDIVLNMADGAIGYLEDDEENEKVFRIAAKALKRGGKHLIDINNAGYAKKHFPCRNWQFGSRSLALADFTWDGERNLMYFGGIDFEYGKPAEKVTELYCDPVRLYSLEELRGIYSKYGMRMTGSYGNFDASVPADDDIFQMQVVAVKAG